MKLIRIFFLFILSWNTVSAQDHIRKFQRFSKEHGLENSRVNAICEDQIGRMWFGTRGGLFSFDGYDFKSYHSIPNDSNSLSAEDVSHLLVAKNGQIWAGTWEGGLNVFDPESEKFTRIWNNHRSQANTITNLVEDPTTGNIWVGTFGAGLYYYDVKNRIFSRCTLPAGEDQEHFNFIESLAYSGDSLIVSDLYTGLGFIRPAETMIRPNKKELLNTLLNGKSNPFGIDEEGRIWFATTPQEITMVDLQTGQKETFDLFVNDRGWEDPIIWNIESDDHGNIWIGTQHGLWVLNPKTKECVHHLHDLGDKRSLPSNIVFRMKCDSRGIIWIGTWEGGIAQYSPQAHQFNSADFSGFEDSKTIFGLDVLNDSIVLAATQMGLFKHNYKTGVVKPIRLPEIKEIDLNYELIRRVHILSDTITYILAEDGPYTWNPQTNKLRYFDQTGINPQKGFGVACRSMTKTKDYLAIGSWKSGLFLYDYTSRSWDNFKYSPRDVNSINSNLVLSFFQDSKDRAWVGTKDGLALYNPHSKSFSRIEVKSKDGIPISHCGIRSFAETPEGLLFMGTNQGLASLNPETNELNFFYTSDGLPNDVIYGLVLVGNYLWVTTNNGLSRMDIRSKTFKNFDQSDGLISQEFTFGGYTSNEEGFLFFGTNNGISYFDPSAIKTNQETPRILFTNLKIRNQTVHPGKNSILPKSLSLTSSITLPRDHKSFSVDFTALTYINPMDCQFAYQLEGFDKERIMTSPTQRTATYTNLNPGEYTLKVWASNNDGIWTNIPKTLSITIKPAFYQTNWFKICLIITVILFLILFNQLRIRNVQRKNKILELKVLARTREAHKKNRLIEAQNKELEITNKVTQDSINYAKTIQEATLPSLDELNSYFKEVGLIYQPKETVSGDFYWLSIQRQMDQEFIYLAVVDCTGHGVPGAFMSLIGSSILDSLVTEENLTLPSAILTELNHKISEALHQHESSNYDGMDLSLIRISKSWNNYQISFSGAKRPLLVYSKRDDKLTLLKGDRRSIGGYKNQEHHFTTEKVNMKSGDILYMYTDGLPDQNNEKRIKIGTKRLISAIDRVKQDPVDVQIKSIKQLLSSHQQNAPQRDDITLLIVELP